MKLCECGCGEPAPIAQVTRSSMGWVKGEPMRFIKGHHRRNGTDGYITASGYKMIRVNPAEHGGKRYEYEHRLVVDAEPGEIVHHINGDKLDNRPENLQVMSQSEHVRLHLH